ncbi:hypothetical protein [Limnohabitans sp. 2KL-17]|uniref:hypothetical protein n=1 Tax=Limnohabitans sp. 2KL-17 TaxID=1100704 RepID=UPI0011B1C711|nr:hypothetical protein [Limnohabitans sp. 2KL-17]
MADSLNFFVPIDTMTDADYRECNYPGQALLKVNLNGEYGGLIQRWIKVPGLAKGNHFKIRGMWAGDPSELRLSGYQISINVPANTIGNNALLTNGVPRATELAVLILKCWLKSQGCTYKGIDALDFENSKYMDVTPTFLHECGTHGNANQRQSDFITASEIRNADRYSGEFESATEFTPKAFSYGSSKVKTAYLSERTHKIPAYVKSRHTKSTAVFSCNEVRERIIDAAESKLRVECKVYEKWLKDNQLTRPEDWRLYGDEAAYRKVYALIRAGLLLDKGLRSRAPKQTDIAKLCMADQEVLRWHLDEDDKHQGRNHPSILNKGDRIAQQKYFSAIKRRVFKALGLDISLPWKIQSAAMSTKLGELLVYPGLYEPPSDLEEHVFSPTSVARMIHTLKVRLDRERTRSICHDHIHPDLQDEPPIRLGQLHVSPLARQHLNHHREPLHKYLSCHKWGVHGELSLSQIQTMTRAAANLEPVQSRYLIGDKHLIVQTEHRPVDGSGADPMTQVRVEGESDIL